MNNITRIGFVLAVMGLSAILLGSFVQPALAQDGQPEKDQTCFNCHQNLYALHDTGKWYCMCGTKARCSYCHGGVVGEVDMEAAHQGIIASPVRDNAAICQSCHPQDYEEHVALFIARGGISPTPLPEPTYIPRHGANSKALTAPLPYTPVPTWRWAGLILASLGLVGAIIFGINCCRQDRKSKENLHE
jgi:hypothetical protein